MDNIQEIWKDVDGFEGFYQVSNLGRVKSIKTGIRKLRLDRYGYTVIILSWSGVVKTKKVHRLVAEAFIPNPEGKPQINHKDFNRRNCNVENLEWCTPKENMKHRIDLRGPIVVLNRRQGVRLNITAEQRISFRSETKLTYECVRIIKCLLNSKERRIRYKEIAEIFGVTQQMIGAINRGSTWSDVNV